MKPVLKVKDSLKLTDADLTGAVAEQRRKELRRGVVVQSTECLAGIVTHPGIRIGEGTSQLGEHLRSAAGVPERTHGSRSRARGAVPRSFDEHCQCAGGLDEWQP